MRRINNKQLIIVLVIFGFMMASFAYLGQVFKWNWSVWWFDIVMHFFGGVFATLVFYAFSRTVFLKKYFLMYPVGKILVLVFLAGIGWELWEAMMGWTFRMIEPYPIDTIMDLIMDMLGAIATIRIVKKNNER
jgi:hypothetical protein